MAFDPVVLPRIQFACDLSFHIAGLGAMIRGIHSGVDRMIIATRFRSRHVAPNGARSTV